MFGWCGNGNSKKMKDFKSPKSTLGHTDISICIGSRENQHTPQMADRTETSRKELDMLPSLNNFYFSSSNFTIQDIVFEPKDFKYTFTY